MCPRMICNRYSPTRASSDSLLLCFVCACLTRLPALRVRLLVFVLPVLRRRRRCGHCTVRCHSSPHLLRLLSACSCVDAASSPRGLALMHCGASFIDIDSAASPPSPPARVVFCRHLTLIILSRFPPRRAPLPNNFMLYSETPAVLAASGHRRRKGGREIRRKRRREVPLIHEPDSACAPR